MEREPHAPRRVARHVREALRAGLLVALAASPGAVRAGEAAASGQGLPAATAGALAESLLAEVETLRGLAFERAVPIRIIDDEGVLAHVARRLEAFRTAEELDRLRRTYELLGLLPADTDLTGLLLEVLREQAGGFYDPPSGTFYVVSDVPEAIAPVVVVHELTHALEDQHYGLDRRLRAVRDDDDRTFALGAVHEGSATLLMLRYLALALARGEIDAGAVGEYFDAERDRSDVLRRVPEVLRRELTAPYVLGPLFLVRGDAGRLAAAGFPVDDVDRVYADPPTSSEQILHPEKYWDESSRDEPRVVELGDAGRALGRRWRPVMRGTLGELTLGSLVAAPTPAVEDLAASAASWTNAAAAGWDGDAWELWVRGESAVVLLGTVWDSPEDAEEFAAALPALDGVRHAVSGRAVAVVAGDHGNRGERVLERALDRLRH